MRLEGAVCLVTGATGGIGRALAVRLAGAGASVIVHGRDPEALAEVASATAGTALSADLTRREEVDRLAADAEAAFGRVDVLVNNAGAGWAGPFADIEPDDADALVRLNLLAPLRLTRALLPGMLGRGRGHVVNIASIAGHVGVRDEAVYSATKAALIVFGETLRSEVARSGVAVTVVSPGAVRTPFFEHRGRPYGRTFPPAIGADRVARSIVHAIRRSRMQVFVPWWMGAVAKLHGAWPSLYRSGAGRYG